MYGCTNVVVDGAGEGLGAPALSRKLRPYFTQGVRPCEAAAWRGAPGFHERIARLQEVLDDFDPRTLELVSER